MLNAAPLPGPLRVVRGVAVMGAVDDDRAT